MSDDLYKNGIFDDNDNEIANNVRRKVKTTDEIVNLKDRKKNITCSYPLYKNTGWKVKTNTNGQLVDLETGRNLYALYYESKPVTEFKIETDGFIVKGIDTIKFLEEKLSILGLTEREAEEFIIYWLPILQENEYNYIRFASTEEINVLKVFQSLNEAKEFLIQ